ncbi:uncharacterized protein BDV14DRAFT_194835 [Aspergillus stella-maris]|uniref:uncharacterized protein n=1 Tax=Aspergillus stella-maris TaxID=1810926 RepID=UPI003CCE4668
MTGFHFTGQRLDNDLVSSVSNLLTEADIPNILWGNYVLSIYGVPTMVEGTFFVVPDEQVDVAGSLITEAGFLKCSKPLECPFSIAPYSPNPHMHMHMTDDIVVGLHRKSVILPRFPDLKIACDDSSPDTMYASDTRLPEYFVGRGGGRFLEPTSVRVPTPLRYCESILWLYCRDYATQLDSYWSVVITYLTEFVEEAGIFNKEDLGEGYKELYYGFYQGRMAIMRLLEEVRSIFAGRKEISSLESEFAELAKLADVTDVTGRTDTITMKEMPMMVQS